MLLPGGGEVADGVAIEGADRRERDGARRQEPQGGQRGGTLLNFDVKAAARLDCEINHTPQGRHRATPLERNVDDIRGIVRCKNDPPAIRGFHRIVVADHDNSVTGEARVDLPHGRSEARGDPESGQRVFVGMGAGAAMANAEWVLDGSRRPAIARDEIRDQRLHSRAPSLSNTKSSVGLTPHSTDAPASSRPRPAPMARSRVPSGRSTA